MSSTMTDEDRRVLELQKRREANIRKKEQQRIEAEALEEQKQKHFLELERQRQSVISQKEEEWALKEEAQRKKDEATILYIREARERRRQEKEAEKLELEEELKRQQKLEQVRLSFLQFLSFAFVPADLLSSSTRPSKRNAFSTGKDARKRSAGQKRRSGVPSWSELKGTPIWMPFASATLKASHSVEAPRKRNFSRKRRSVSSSKRYIRIQFF